jgi:hypothetical protein
MESVSKEEHEAGQAFYKLTVAQRNAAWYEVEQLKAKLAAAEAENAELRKAAEAPEEATRRLGHEYTGRSMGDWYHTDDEEHFSSDHYPDRESALAAARDECPDGLVWTGRAEHRTMAGMAGGARLAGHVLDFIMDEAYEWGVEFSDSWREAVQAKTRSHQSLQARGEGHNEPLRELEQALMRTVDRWADKHDMQPSFFMAEDVKEHQPEEPDGE